MDENVDYFNSQFNSYQSILTDDLYIVNLGATFMQVNHVQ